MICLFIDVAIEMHELRNFAGLSSVITALCIDMIARLRQSWALVPQEMSDRLQVHSCLGLAPLAGADTALVCLPASDSLPPSLPLVSSLLPDLCACMCPSCVRSGSPPLCGISVFASVCVHSCHALCVCVCETLWV